MSYKIAAATSDGKNIDLHFGEVKSVSVYEVNEENGSFAFVEERQISLPIVSAESSSETGCTCGKEFTDSVSQTVKDCVYLLVAKIGNRPYRFLQENNVNCVEAPYCIDEAVEKINAYYTTHRKRESHVF